MFGCCVFTTSGLFNVACNRMTAMVIARHNFIEHGKLIHTECSSSTQVALLVARRECCAVLPSFARAQLPADRIDDYSVKGLKDLERTLCIAWSPRRAEIRPVVKEAAKLKEEKLVS